MLPVVFVQLAEKSVVDRCFQMRQKLVRAVRLVTFMTAPVTEERSGSVWLKARAKGKTWRLAGRGN